MRKMLRVSLEGHGFRVVEAARAADACALAASSPPEVILLDLGLPDGDGIDVTRRLRQSTATPILVISARSRENDKVAALDAGANDYLTKPFSTGELLARIRVWLRCFARRAAAAEEQRIQVGPLRIDLTRRLVFAGDREVHLTPIEYKLFAVLMHHAGCLLTHRQLLEAAWGSSRAADTHYVRIYMRQLRQKLEPDDAHPRYIVTEPGVGYRLCAG